MKTEGQKIIEQVKGEVSAMPLMGIRVRGDAQFVDCFAKETSGLFRAYAGKLNGSAGGAPNADGEDYHLCLSSHVELNRFGVKLKKIADDLAASNVNRCGGTIRIENGDGSVFVPPSRLKMLQLQLAG